MKKLLIANLLFIATCHKADNHEQLRAENLIKKHMNNPVTGAPDYEKVTFSAIRSMWQTFSETRDGITLMGRIKLEDDSIAKLDGAVDSLAKNRAANRDKIAALRKSEWPLLKKLGDDMKKNLSLMMKFKGQLKGYKMKYTYKVKDTDNNYYFIYHQTTFRFDPTLSKITAVKDTIIDATEIEWR